MPYSDTELTDLVGKILGIEVVKFRLIVEFYQNPIFNYVYRITGTAESYKRGCKVRERDAREIHRPLIEKSMYTFSPDPDYCRIIEFYCPSCGTMIENEYLPPGHPIMEDIQLDIQKLKAKYKEE